MEVTYKYRLDEAYLRIVVARYYQQRPWYLRPWGQFAILTALLFCAYLFGERSIGTPLPEIAMSAIPPAAVLFFGGIFLTKWRTIEKFRRRADFGAEVTVSMNEDGLSAEGPHVQGKWTWQAYPQGLRYPDGILLMRTGMSRWLPDTAIQVGTAEMATRLVASKTSLRHTGRKVR